MDIKAVQELIAALEASTLARLQYEDKTLKITLEKFSSGVVAVAPQAAVPSAPAQAPASPAPAVRSGTVVTAPIVGTVYRAKEPGQKPLVSVGDKVKKGDALCLIEAMKLFSEVTAPCAGIVQEIHFTDGDLAEFGMPLLTIEEQT